ncbi:hypothetical protein C7212DRAFT_323694 [Tuber magnatum]|uniref:Uncharacterized protein n=1 Tax=Tuber magnatum TaxID=42249 RepID=A0A317SV87_9PEZI|nr:hypothetical protein C7212DRAFT_323694 [Tuber magnatum]
MPTSLHARCSPPPPLLTLPHRSPPHPNSYNSAALRASTLETSLRVSYSSAIGPAVSGVRVGSQKDHWK